MKNECEQFLETLTQEELQALCTPREPNEAFKKAFEEYHERKVNDGMD